MWFWDSVVLVQTLALAAAQVFTTTLDIYFQLTVMLLILFIGSIVLTYFDPFEEQQSQRLQVKLVGSGSPVLSYNYCIIPALLLLSVPIKYRSLYTSVLMHHIFLLHVCINAG